MKQKIANVRVSLPMIFLVALLLKSWSLSVLVIAGTLVVGLYLWEKGDPRGRIFMMVGLAVEIGSCVLELLGFLSYEIGTHDNIRFHIPDLAAQAVYTVMALVLFLKLLKKDQRAGSKALRNILYGGFVLAMVFALGVHFGMDGEILSLSELIWLAFRLVTLILIERAYLRNQVPAYPLLKSAVLVLVVIIGLSMLGNMSSFAGGAPAVNRCRSCGRSFQAGSGDGFMSIARSGMCSDCYTSFEGIQRAIGK